MSNAQPDDTTDTIPVRAARRHATLVMFAFALYGMATAMFSLALETAGLLPKPLFTLGFSPVQQYATNGAVLFVAAVVLFWYDLRTSPRELFEDRR